MTVVVKGRMSTQVSRPDAGSLVLEGERVFLNQGDVGYRPVGGVHDAKYIDDCPLVYVHDGAFAFIPANPEDCATSATSAERRSARLRVESEMYPSRD